MTHGPDSGASETEDRGPSAPEGPLSNENVQQLADAMHRSAKIGRASRMASVNGWVLGVSAAFSALLAPFVSGGLIAFAVLAALAWNEFRGKKLLDALDPGGARILWQNQAALMAVILLYCAWGIRSTLTGPVSPSVAELEVLMPEIAELMQDLTVVFYVVLALATVLFQGGMIRFYRDRVEMIGVYLSETPAWTIEVVRIVRSGGRTRL